MSRPTVSLAQIIFSFCIAFQLFIVLNGYALNLAGLPANPSIIFILLVPEFFALAFLARRLAFRVSLDALRLGGFLLVVVGTWLYLIIPSLPGLLPPSYSGDPALHLNFINTVYFAGKIISGDPGGPSLIAATLAHWANWDPVYVMYPLASLWLALAAGAIYGAACSALPDCAASKIISLVAAFALFCMWNYFAGIILAAHFFFSQVAGQVFIAAFIWYLFEYRRTNHPAWQVFAAICLVALIVFYQIWLILPVTTFTLVIVQDWRYDSAARQRAFVIALAATAALVVLVAIILAIHPEFIPALDRLNINGVVIEPTFYTLGNWFLLVPLVGFIFIFLDQGHARTFSPLIAGSLAQTLVLEFTHRWLGAGVYWVNKTFFLWAFTLALMSVIPFARLYEFAKTRLKISARPVVLLFVVFAAFAGWVAFLMPAPHIVPIAESDVRVALWARAHLDTPQINYLGTKSLTAQWIGVGLWREEYPADLMIDLARLGPRTFAEWRGDPAWGNYLFISSNQPSPNDTSLETIYRDGASAILSKPRASTPSPTPRGNFGDTFAITNYQLPKLAINSGETLTVTAQFIPLRVPSLSVVWRLQLRDRNGNSVADASVAPFQDKFPLQRWSPGKILTDTFTLPITSTLQPGLYHLQLGLYRVPTGEPLTYVSAEGNADDVMQLEQIKIPQPGIAPESLSTINPVQAQVGDFATLLGYRLGSPSPLRPGDSFPIELFWQAKVRMANDYTVFVQILDANEKLIAQNDSAPRAGAYPTSIWDAGEIILDSHTLTLAPDAAPGEYQFIVGMYAFPSLQRLPVSGNGARAENNFVVLPGKVQIK